MELVNILKGATREQFSFISLVLKFVTVWEGEIPVSLSGLSRREMGNVPREMVDVKSLTFDPFFPFWCRPIWLDLDIFSFSSRRKCFKVKDKQLYYPNWIKCKWMKKEMDFKLAGKRVCYSSWSSVSLVEHVV